MIHKLFSYSIRFIPVLIVVLIVAEIAVANQLACFGIKVRSTDVAIATLQEENQRLLQEVASASSLLTLTGKAKELGFIASHEYNTMGASESPVAYMKPQ